MNPKFPASNHLLRLYSPVFLSDLVENPGDRLFFLDVARISETTTNLALGKAASQSSVFTEDSDFSAKTAIDNCTSKYFWTKCCSSTKEEYNPWWKIDMGEMTSISKIKIYRRWDCKSLHFYDISHVVRKPVFGVSDQIRHKPVCTATEDG